MQLHINPHDEAPVYRQIQRQIATAIAERRIHPGELLQSQEDLATKGLLPPGLRPTRPPRRHRVHRQCGSSRPLRKN